MHHRESQVVSDAKQLSLSGFVVTPVIPGGKCPRLNAWTERRLDDRQISEVFSPTDNLGAVMGVSSDKDPWVPVCIDIFSWVRGRSPLGKFSKCVFRVFLSLVEGPGCRVWSVFVPGFLVVTFQANATRVVAFFVSTLSFSLL